jgi:uncharacterized membrane protein YoaK (UPF0700 family)
MQKQSLQPRLNTLNPVQERRLIPVLLLVTFTTGMVEAVSYLHLGHVFVAYLTGTLLLFGAYLVGIGMASPFGSAVAIVSFLAGAILGGRLVRRNRAAPRILTDLLVINIALLLVAAVIAGGGEIATNQLRQYLIIALLSIALGGQISGTRHLNVQDLVTPLATGIVHGLAHDSRFAGGNFQLVYRRVGVVVALLAGAAAGAGLAALQLWAALLLAAGLVALAAVLAYRVPVADANIQLAGGNGQTLPTDSQKITVVIQPVPGA